jgi:hypothetical protein
MNATIRIRVVKLILITYFNNINPDRRIQKLTQNTKLTGILNFIIPNPTITLPVGIMNPKNSEIIQPINKI